MALAFSFANSYINPFLPRFHVDMKLSRMKSSYFLVIHLFYFIKFI